MPKVAQAKGWNRLYLLVPRYHPSSRITRALVILITSAMHSTSFTRIPFKLALQGEFIQYGITGFQLTRLSVHADRIELLVPVFALSIFNFAFLQIVFLVRFIVCKMTHQGGLSENLP